MNKLLCPITFSLPVDPVIAEDGKVYDRSAIEEWLKKQRKSPVTNLAMGTKLLPAPQVTGMIRTMVIKGALTGDKVDAWRQRMKEKEEVEEMRCLAEASNGGAMCNLGHWYKHGEKGLAKDEAKAFEWFEKSHEAGNVCGSGHLGRCYLLGYGVPTCQALDQVWRSRGATLLSEAAGRGSKRACFNLGFACTPRATMASRRTRRWRAATTRWWCQPRLTIAPLLTKRQQPHGCVSVHQLESVLVSFECYLRAADVL